MQHIFKRLSIDFTILTIIIMPLVPSLAQAQVVPAVNKPPVITGTSGPTSLYLNLNGQASGTWTVNAYDPDGTDLSYSVSWGDVTITPQMQTKVAPQINTAQNASFEHTYTGGGNYTIKFIVSDAQGASTSASLTVNILGVSKPSISITSPMGGENWRAGETYKITWSSQGIPQSAGLTITVFPYPECLDKVPVCATAQVVPESIAVNAPNTGVYSWTIPTNYTGVSVGRYKLSIVYNNSADTSDARYVVGMSQAFNILPTKVIYQSPVITSVDGPNKIYLNSERKARGTWKVKAYYSGDGSLSYAVNWGESTESPDTRPVPNSSDSVFAVFEHTYTAPGVYNITFTVTDLKGAEAKANTKVEVLESKTSTLPSNTMKAAKSGYYAFKTNWYHGAANVNFFDPRKVVRLESDAKPGDSKLTVSAPLDNNLTYIIFSPATNQIEDLFVDTANSSANTVVLSQPLVRGDYPSTANGKTIIAPLMGSYWGHLPDTEEPYNLGYFKEGEEITIGYTTIWHTTLFGPTWSTNSGYYFFKANDGTCFTAQVDDGLQIGALDASFDVYYVGEQPAVKVTKPIRRPTVKAENWTRSETASTCHITESIGLPKPILPVPVIVPAPTFKEPVINIEAIKLSEGAIKDEHPVANDQEKLKELLSRADGILAKISALQAELNKVTAEADSIKQFIALGTPTTARLGENERAKVVANYQAVFKKLPDQESEWSDVLKIANGQKPEERNLAKEKEAQKYFRRLVKRAPDINKPSDDAAISYIAYGVRPEVRDLKAEAIAVKKFRSNFGKNPKTDQDWNIVRAGAYSGVLPTAK